MSPHLLLTRMQKKLAILQLLKHREPTLLIVGQTISGFGDGVALVALTLLVLDSTHHSVTKLAWFAAGRMAPSWPSSSSSASSSIVSRGDSAY
jgi:hypothetical protein